MSPVRRRALLLAPLALGAFLLLVGVAFESARIVQHPFPGFLFWDNGTLVSFHQESWTGPAAGLPLNGGRIVEVEGDPFRDGRSLLARISELEPGAPVRYRVSAGSETREFSVPSMVLPWSGYLATFGVYLFNGFVFLQIALIAVLLRPELVGARALAFATGCMGLLYTLAIDYFCGYRLVPAYLIVEGLTPAALWYFVLVFPVERCARRTQIAAAAVFSVVGLGLGLANLFSYHTDPALSRAITLAIYVLISLAGLAMVASFGESLFRAASPRTRVQASIVFFGGFAGLVLPAVAVLAFFVLGWTISASWIAVLLPILPLSMLYAIVRHDLLGVERFVRLATGYALSSAVVVAVYALVILLFGRVVEGRAEVSPVISPLVIVAIAVGFDPLRRLMQDWVDRVFYRTRVDAAQVLEEIGAKLVRLSDEEEIRGLVERTCQESLSVAWAHFEPEATRIEDADLQQRVVFQGQHRGVLGCGPKLSGAPFAPRERELLSGLATQTALALETARSMAALRRAQDMLVRSERLAAIGEFSASVAHGIRNPLSGIRATAEAGLDEGGDRTDILLAIRRESDRLEQRIQTLLEYSQPFEPALRRVDLVEVLVAVRRAIARRAEREGIDVALDVPDRAVPAETDPDYLEEALLELVGNSLRVVVRGGRVGLALESVPGMGATIRIQDSGPGIPEGVRDRIFDLFFTTRREGTGLGLATVRKIIRRLGGRVCLESSGPAGSTFRIDLEDEVTPSESPGRS